MMYLSEYKMRLNEMSSTHGHTCRVMYSPISKTISIHYFNLKKPLTSPGLMEDLNYYRENYLVSGQNEKIFSGIRVRRYFTSFFLTEVGCSK